MSDVPLGSDRLRDRLVLAAVNALTKDDPLLMIGIGDNEIRLGWADPSPVLLKHESAAADIARNVSHDLLGRR